MGLEASFDNIDDLDPLFPLDNDAVEEGDDHLRGIKKALQGTITGDAASVELRIADGATIAVQVLAESIHSLTELNQAQRLLASNFVGGVDLSVAGGSGVASINNLDSLGAVKDPYMTFDPLGDTSLFHAGLLTIKTAAFGMQVVDETTDAPQIRLVGAASELHAQIFANAAGLTMKSLRHGQPVILSGEDNVGDTQNLMTGDPDAAVSLYHAGGLRIRTTATGMRMEGSLLEILSFDDLDTKLRALNTIGGVSLEVLSVDAQLVIRQLSTTGSSEDRWIDAQRNGRVRLFFDGQARVETQSTGLKVFGAALDLDNDDTGTTRARVWNNDGGVALFGGASSSLRQLDGTGAASDVWVNMAQDGAVQLYWNGVSHLRTQDFSVVSSFASGAACLDAFGDMRAIGHTRLSFSQFNTETFALRKTHNEGKIRIIGACNLDLDLATEFDDHSTVLIYCGDGTNSGTLRIRNNSTQVRFYSGFDVTNITAAQALDLSNGAVATITRLSIDAFEIFGAGISVV